MGVMTEQTTETDEGPSTGEQGAELIVDSGEPRHVSMLEV